MKSSGNIVSGNTSTNNGRVYIRSATGILVNGDNNPSPATRRPTNEDTGIQVSAAGAAAAPASGNIVLSNVSYGNLDHGIDLSQAPSTSILGNSVYKNATAGIDAESSSTGITVANNISAGQRHRQHPDHGQIRVDTGSQAGTVVNSNLVFNSSNEALYTWGLTTYTPCHVLPCRVWPGCGGPLRQPASGSTLVRATSTSRADSPAIDNADTTVAGLAELRQGERLPAQRPWRPGVRSRRGHRAGCAHWRDGSGRRGQCLVKWTAPDNGGCSITGYTVTA